MDLFRKCMEPVEKVLRVRVPPRSWFDLPAYIGCWQPLLTGHSSSLTILHASMIPG